MKQVDITQLVNALHDVGVQPGSGLLVHSAIQFLGKPVGGLQTYLQAFDEVIGIFKPSNKLNEAGEIIGTLVVPTFNFAFARSVPFDPKTTPAVGMGTFSEYIRNHPLALRSPHPLQSIAALGYYAEDLTSRDTPSAFEHGSAFERMIELGFDLLLLGADIQAVSLLHYSEQRLKVPYRYWKEFKGKFKTTKGWEWRAYQMYVRDLDINPQLSLHKVQKELEEQNLWWSVPINYGSISRCRIVDFIKVVEHFIAIDPWSLVLNRPLNVSSQTSQ